MYILNENIRRYRKERGMTQRELAERLGTTDKTASRWESGVQIPDAETVPALARIFDVSIGELYGEEKPTATVEAAVAGEIGEKVAEFPAANRRALRRTWFATILSMFFVLLGAFGLCLNNFYAVSVRTVGYLFLMGTAQGRVLGLGLLLAGTAGLVAALTAFRGYYQEQSRFNFRYADTDMTLRLIAVILYCALFLFVLPRFFGFPVNALYIAAVYLAAYAVNLDLVLEKHRLRRYSERFSTVMTALSWVIGGLSLAAFLVCVDLHVIEMMEIQQLTDSRSVVGIAQRLLYEEVINSWLGGQYYYFLLAVSLPLTAMLLLNVIEMKVHTNRSRVKYSTDFTEESKDRSPIIRLIAGVIAFAVFAGAVPGVLKLSGALKHYEAVTVVTDSMKPTLHSGDTVSVCTDVDKEHLEWGSIILFNTTDGVQMLGRISRVNYDDDWNALSYKVVQDNPDMHDKRLVYPQDVIGVWLDAPMPESSDEYDYGY